VMKKPFVHLLVFNVFCMFCGVNLSVLYVFISAHYDYWFLNILYIYCVFKIKWMFGK
jgi:hypothetical protein